MRTGKTPDYASLHPGYSAVLSPGSLRPMSSPMRETLHRLLHRLPPLLPARLRGGAAVVPVVRMSGVIGFSTPLRPGLTISTVARSLERAFAVRNASAVALAINSPGGSAVQ